ncbi:MAG: hypothetical protein ACPLW6_05450 [Desulfurella sp.]
MKAIQNFAHEMKLSTILLLNLSDISKHIATYDDFIFRNSKNLAQLTFTHHLYFTKLLIILQPLYITIKYQIKIIDNFYVRYKMIL